MAGIRAATGNEAVWFLPLDLADLDSVRACATAFLALGEPLHVLVNNAGVVRARGLTKQGFELMFGVNHLGHFALTNALLGCLTASAPARVVTVSSDSHYSARGIDFEALRRPERGITGLHGYAVSKLCNVLFSQELARRTADTGVTSYALHPGVVASDIWRRVPWPVRPLMTRRMLTVDEGAATSLYCATSPDVAQDSGKFYDKCAERDSQPGRHPRAGRGALEAQRGVDGSAVIGQSCLAPYGRGLVQAVVVGRGLRNGIWGGVQEASGSIWRSIRPGVMQLAFYALAGAGVAATPSLDALRDQLTRLLANMCSDDPGTA